MAKVGRPAWTPPPLDQVERLAARGLTEEQIAHCLGISQMTLIQKKKEYLEFAEAIKRGQAKGIAEVTNSLYKSTKREGKEAITAQIFYLKCRAGWKETDVHEIMGKNGKPIDIKMQIKFIKPE